MGIYASKLLFHTDESQKENIEVQEAAKQDSNISTPVCTNKKLLIDPRSASAGIIRTPIEVNSTPVGVTKKISNAFPKHLQKTQYLETDMDTVMLPLTPKKNRSMKLIDSTQSSPEDVTKNYLTTCINTKDKKDITLIEKERYKILGLDPRSPAADFDRTPILKPKSLALMKIRSQEYLSRKGSYETDVYNPKVSCREVNELPDIPIIHVPDIASKGLKSLNLDIQSEIGIPNTPQSDSSIFVSEEEITIIKNPKFQSKLNKSLTAIELIFDKEEDKTDKQDDYKDIEQNMKVVHIKDDDKIKIWHDSIEENVSGKIQEKESDEKKLQEQIPKEDVIITFDNIKNTFLSNTKKIEENIQKKENGEKKKPIFKTEEKFKSGEIFSPDNNHETVKNRTPLGNRSNNGKIQGMSTKSPQQLLKNTKIQNENTPPQKKSAAKSRNEIQWDSNSTIII